MANEHTQISKFIYNGDVVFDLTADTVTPGNLLAGYTAHNEFGDAIVGEATSATLLRYNSLTNWNASDVILDEGEIVMAYDDSSGTTNYLMKIGDGTHTFADLPAFRPYDIQVLNHIPTAAETNNNMITFVV